MLLRLEQFSADDYATLISWVDSKELLMQFAGPAFVFPLTNPQLDDYLNDANRQVFKVVVSESDIAIGHAEIYLTQEWANLGRILIGKKEHRGKGLGQQITKLLLQTAFSTTGKTKAALNVFEWNIGAIKCYEKVGFTINPDKTLERKINGKNWIALHMVLDKSVFESMNLTLA